MQLFSQQGRVGSWKCPDRPALWANERGGGERCSRSSWGALIDLPAICVGRMDADATRYGAMDASSAGVEAHSSQAIDCALSPARPSVGSQDGGTRVRNCKPLRPRPPAARRRLLALLSHTKLPSLVHFAAAVRASIALLALCGRSASQVAARCDALS